MPPGHEAKKKSKRDPGKQDWEQCKGTHDWTSQTRQQPHDYHALETHHALESEVPTKCQL